MLVLANILALASLGAAAVAVIDPSDYVDLADDASDNSIKADYENVGASYQTITITGPYYYSSGNDTSLDHVTLTVDANDTSVVVVTEDTQVNLSYVEVIKEGYSSDLNQASFFGSNAAINVANGSVVNIDHSNVTVHNGAANIYSYGTDTIVYVSNSDLYSSGPTSHGLYGAGNGTIYGTNLRHYSGGNRCSSFSGDSPAAYLYVNDSVAHTAGIGSAIFFAVGEIYGTNVVGLAEQAPVLFMDGDQTAVFEDVDLTAGLLAITVLFSSSTRGEGGVLSFSNSRLAANGSDLPGLWFGNTIASVSLYSTEIVIDSDILLVANSSQVTQEFDFFAGGEQNSAILPAIVDVVVGESTLAGDLVAYNGSSVAWSLTSHSTWTGSAYSAYEESYFAVALDESSTWVLTNDTTLQNFTDADTTLSNIESAGYTIYYDSSSAANNWLNGSTKSLSGGGYLKAA